MARIFSTKLAIDSMKDSGYKDAAYAVSELIDNSIQAGENLDYPVDVELICIEEKNLINQRTSSKINKIAVYDNAEGMPKDTLRESLAFGQGTRKGANTGMGKFGMGLPNASISQANRVDVWSWQDNIIQHTYLDLNEIADQDYDEIPDPKQVSSLPKEWTSKFKTAIKPCGTLVVWSELSRLKWKRHKAFFSNTEFIVGRIYRYFINDEKCRIRMAAFKGGENNFDDYVKPNDPLYLMKGTNSPPPFNVTPAFDKFGEDFPITINYQSKVHTVILKTSISKSGFRREAAEEKKNAGDAPIGKHCVKNQGVSVVRAGRELELSRSFDKGYDTTDRWWGIEVSFEPALDEVFGVTNNKQAATAFKQLSFSEIAEDEGISRGKIESFLQEENDIRLPIIQISHAISSKLSSMRDSIKAQTKGVKIRNKAESGRDGAQAAADEATQNDQGTGASDKKEEELTHEEKEKELEDELEHDGVELDEEDKDTIIASWLNDSKYIFTNAELRGSRFIFDVSQPGGKIKITFNTSHPAYNEFIRQIEEDDGHSLDALKLLFAAWARMEDLGALDQERKEVLEDIRFEWGNIAKNMLDEYTK